MVQYNPAFENVLAAIGAYTDGRIDATDPVQLTEAVNGLARDLITYANDAGVALDTEEKRAGENVDEVVEGLMEFIGEDGDRIQYEIDDLVHYVFSLEASGINNEGMASQLAELATHLGVDSLRAEVEQLLAAVRSDS